MGSGGTIDTGAEENSASQIISATDLSALFDSMAIGSELATYVTTLVNDIYNIINRSGVQMLIYLAGLQSISGAIYESCSIDGASAWETFWKITLPMVSPMILVNTVYTVIDSFTSSTNTVMRKVDAAYADVMNYSDSFAVSTAMAWIYFAIIIVAIGLVMLLLKTFIFYQRKE
jgi:ABC-type sugar transport system permease subunit